MQWHATNSHKIIAMSIHKDLCEKILLKKQITTHGHGVFGVEKGLENSGVKTWVSSKKVGSKLYGVSKVIVKNIANVWEELCLLRHHEDESDAGC